MLLARHRVKLAVEDRQAVSVVDVAGGGVDLPAVMEVSACTVNEERQLCGQLCVYNEWFSTQSTTLKYIQPSVTAKLAP